MIVFIVVIITVIIGIHFVCARSLSIRLSQAFGRTSFDVFKIASTRAMFVSHPSKGGGLNNSV